MVFGKTIIFTVLHESGGTHKFVVLQLKVAKYSRMGTDRCVLFRQLSAIVFDYDLESMMKKYVEIGIGN